MEISVAKSNTATVSDINGVTGEQGDKVNHSGESSPDLEKSVVTRKDTRGQGENIEKLFKSSQTSIPNHNNGNGHNKAVVIEEKQKKKQGDEVRNSSPSSPSPSSSPSHFSTSQSNSQLNMHMQGKPNKIPNYEQVLESLEYVLTQFGQNQNENLQVHSQYLNHQVEYIRTFFRLMEQQNTL
ncbi:MAG: hypothetical protein AAF063_38265, partial [Cyanobacteria bacterium J06643_5]